MTDRCETAGRLVRQLEDLLRTAPEQPAERASAGSSAMIDAARAAIDARRGRDRVFGAGTFADPAWDILLDLFLAGEENRAVDAFGLCGRSPLAEGVILRSIAHLVQSDLVTRQANAADPRSIYLALTAEGRAKMLDYLSRAAAIAGGVAA